MTTTRDTLLRRRGSTGLSIGSTSFHRQTSVVAKKISNLRSLSDDGVALQLGGPNKIIESEAKVDINVELLLNDGYVEQSLKIHVLF